MDLPYYPMKVTYFAQTPEENIGLEKLKNAVHLSSQDSGHFSDLSEVFKALGIDPERFCTYFRYTAWIQDNALCMEGLFYLDTYFITFEALARALGIQHVAFGDYQENEVFINTDTESRFLKDQYVLSFPGDRDWETISEDYPLYMLSTFDDFETLADIVTILRKEVGIAIPEDIEEDIEQINGALIGTVYKIYKRKDHVSYTEEGERVMDAFAKAYWSRNNE